MDNVVLTGSGVCTLLYEIERHELDFNKGESRSHRQRCTGGPGTTSMRCVMTNLVRGAELSGYGAVAVAAAE